MQTSENAPHTLAAQLELAELVEAVRVDSRKAQTQAVAILWVAYERCGNPAARGLISHAIGHITGQTEAAKRAACPIVGAWRKHYGSPVRAGDYGR
jgi:hypothetical protein